MLNTQSSCKRTCPELLAFLWVHKKCTLNFNPDQEVLCLKVSGIWAPLSRIYLHLAFTCIYHWFIVIIWWLQHQVMISPKSNVHGPLPYHFGNIADRREAFSCGSWVNSHVKYAMHMWQLLSTLIFMGPPLSSWKHSPSLSLLFFHSHLFHNEQNKAHVSWVCNYLVWP